MCSFEPYELLVRVQRCHLQVTCFVSVYVCGRSEKGDSDWCLAVLGRAWYASYELKFRAEPLAAFNRSCSPHALRHSSRWAAGPVWGSCVYFERRVGIGRLFRCGGETLLNTVLSDSVFSGNDYQEAET